MTTGKELSDAIKASNAITYKSAFDTGHYHGRQVLQKDIDKAIDSLVDAQMLMLSNDALKDGHDTNSPPALSRYLRAILHAALNDILWDQRDAEAEAKFADAVIDPSRAGSRQSD